MHWYKFTQIDLSNPLLAAGLGIAIVTGYILIFNRSWKIGLAILALFILGLIYFNADWEYWRLYHKL